MTNALDLNKIFMNSDIIREKGAFDEIIVGLTIQYAQGIGINNMFIIIYNIVIYIIYDYILYIIITYKYI